MALQGNLSEDRNVYIFDFPACYARVVEVRTPARRAACA